MLMSTNVNNDVTINPPIYIYIFPWALTEKQTGYLVRGKCFISPKRGKSLRISINIYFAIITMHCSPTTWVCNVDCSWTFGGVVNQHVVWCHMTLNVANRTCAVKDKMSPVLLWTAPSIMVLLPLFNYSTLKAIDSLANSHDRTSL